MGQEETSSATVLETVPKDLFAGVYSPGRRLGLLQIQTENTLGANAQILGVFSRMGVKVCSGFLNAAPDAQHGFCGFMVDLTDTDFIANDVVSELKRLDPVVSVRVREPPIPGLIVDDVHFPVRALGQRSIIIGADALATGFGKLQEVFGSAAAVIVWEMGVRAGQQAIWRITSRYHVKNRAALELALAEHSAIGTCRAEIVEFDHERGMATLHAHGLYECLPFQNLAREGRSHAFRGFLTGALQEVFKRAVKVTEESSVAKGDGYCSFFCR